VVDFKAKELLVVYNKKVQKWLQPGGHSEGDETPLETATREVKEETGIDIIPIGVKFNNHVEPFAVEIYDVPTESMLDIQFVAIPKSKVIIDKEGNHTRWVTLEELRELEPVDEELREKFDYILNVL
jgi:8-oxo-dGTP pyrophosphatase MutT (NUDIX family)